ncbi:MAG: ribosome silencing factor [Campylobacter sp.]
MQDRIERIVKILDEKKAENIEAIDMRSKEYFTNFVIIATTLGERHAYSLIDELKVNLKDNGENFLAVESSEEWSVIDLGDILIHLMSAEYRTKYNIEEFLAKLQEQRS